MPSLKLTKTAVETAKPETRDYELRDTALTGFLCKVTPAGRKVFMLQYRTPTGERRKPSLGTFGQLTVDQARKLAQDHLAAVRAGEDPSQERQEARGAPTVKELSERFMTEYSEARNKPSSVRGNRLNLRVHVLPAFGRMKIAKVKRPDVAGLIGRMRATPAAANHTLSLLRKMFNMAELWGMRPDGTNPCRHVLKYTGQKRTRLITDQEMVRLYAYLDRADAEGLEHPVLTLAVRLQFEFAARMSEVLDLRWEWIDLALGVDRPWQPTGGLAGQQDRRRVEALECRGAAPPGGRAPLPSIRVRDPVAVRRVEADVQAHLLGRVAAHFGAAGLPHCGTHAVRHRAATDIANSGVPIKVGTALTAHKTVTMFMRYVHTEDDPIRAAAETVANRRRGVVGGAHPPAAPAAEIPAAAPAPAPVRPEAPPAPARLLGLEDGNYTSKTKLGSYRPYRKRKGENRAAPPKRASDTGVHGDAQRA